MLFLTDASHAKKVPVKQQNSSQGPPSMTYVKMEDEKAELQKQFNNTSFFTSSPVRTTSRGKRYSPCSMNSPNIQEKNDNCLLDNSDILNNSNSQNHQVFIKEETVSPSCSEYIKSQQFVAHFTAIYAKCYYKTKYF